MRSIVIVVLLALLGFSACSGGDNDDEATGTRVAPAPRLGAERKRTPGPEGPVATSPVSLNFALAAMDGAQMVSMDLAQASFAGTSLVGASFSGSDLTDANFAGANLYQATMRSTQRNGINWGSDGEGWAVCPDGSSAADNDGTCEGHLGDDVDVPAVDGSPQSTTADGRGPSPEVTPTEPAQASTTTRVDSGE